MEACEGSHRFFVCETGIVDDGHERAVFVLAMCVACGDFKVHKLDLSDTRGKIELLPKKENKNNVK